MLAVNPRFLLFGDPMTQGPNDRDRVRAQIVRLWTDELLEIAHRQVYVRSFSKAADARESHPQGARAACAADARRLSQLVREAEKHSSCPQSGGVERRFAGGCAAGNPRLRCLCRSKAFETPLQV